LPPGADNINIYLPFKADVTEESFRSHLDIEGRKVIVINKLNMHSYYAKNFLVTYKLTPRKMYEKVIMMVVFFMAFYFLMILLSRINLRIK
jgi:hypothetical protein